MIKHRNVKQLASTHQIFRKLNIRLTRLYVAGGWLWAMKTAHALPFNAAMKIDLGSATVAVVVPGETS